MAEDGDDDTFGDFAFAPAQSISTSNSADDWGDFVRSPQPSTSSDAPDKSPAWMKPRGALPLSIFGYDDEEEEEEKGNSGGAWGFDRGTSGANDGDFNSKLGGQNAPNPSQNLNIADLYSRYGQINPEQGRGTNSTGVAASVDNEACLRSCHSVSRSAVSEPKSVGLDDCADQNQLTNEEIHFKSQEHVVSKNEDLFGSWTQEFYGVGSNLNTSDPKSLISNAGLDTTVQIQQLDGSDDEWEFKDAQSENVNNNEISNRDIEPSATVIDLSKSRDVVGTSNGSVNFFFAPSESVDYFATSTGVPATSLEIDLFGNQMGTSTLNGWNSDTKSNIEQTNTRGDLDNGANVGGGDFDEDFGEFTAASAELDSKPQEVSTDDIFPASECAAPIPDGKFQVDFMVPEVSKRHVNSSGSVFGGSNGSMDFFATSAEPIDLFASSSPVSKTSKEVLPDVYRGNVNSSGSVFGGSNGSIDFFATSAEPVDYFATPGSVFNTSIELLPEDSKRNVNSSGSVFAAANGSIDLFATLAEPVDFFTTSSGISSTSKAVDLFGSPSTALNGYTSDTDANTEQVKVKETLSRTPDFDGAEVDEDFGDFTSAAAETGLKLGVDLSDDGATERTDSFLSASSSKKSVDVFEMSNGSTNFFGTSMESVDFFAPSSGTSSTFKEEDLNGNLTSRVTSNGLMHETNSTIEQSSIDGTLEQSTDDRDLEFDDDFGDFTAAAAAETEPHPVEVDMKSNYQNGAIPLSIFGNNEPEIEEPQSGGLSDVQDVYKFQSTSDQRNRHTQAAVISINDLVSSLYSQAEQASPKNAPENPVQIEQSLSNAIPNCSVDDLDGNMWDFKDAPQTSVESERYLNGIGDTHLNVSSQLKLNNCLDFYHKLKEELCYVIKRHIEDLKYAQDGASLFGEDTRVASLDSEFQLVSKELEQLQTPLEETNSQDHLSGETLTTLSKVLLEPPFQILESEYHLSKKLLEAEKDEQSAMELIRHTAAMLKILTTGSLEDRKAYISIWFEMISACARELRHGASIWNEAVEKQVQGHLLTEPQGRKYVLCLGEIYRVVAVLGASAKLYKPWTLMDAVDLPTLYPLLQECHAVWSSSGLEKALSSISSPIDPASLLTSIKDILSVDALVLQNYVCAKNVSLCQLSLLTAEVAPGMQMSTWENQKCFVKLANLWANMIDLNPPKLPQLSNS